MKPDLDALMKEAQKMQEQMQSAQKELANLQVIGEAGAGLVKVAMKGNHDVAKVTINPNLMDDDVEMLEDLVAAATNDAVRKVEKASKEKITQLTSGLNLPTDLGGIGDE